MSAAQLRQRLEAMLEFMEPHWEFVNCHMVNYLTDRHWQQHVPADLRADVESSVQRVRCCIESVFWRGAESEGGRKFPAISQFLATSKKHCLKSFPEVLTSDTELQRQLGQSDSYNACIVSIKEFMSEKKRHEVEIMAALINDLIKSQLAKEARERQSAEMFVVDAGDGKGYLSSRLALQYGHKVLGIDFNATNTQNALQRNKKLQRAWTTLTERAAMQHEGITPPRRGNKQKSKRIETCEKLDNYKTTSRYISTELDLQQLLATHFHGEERLRRCICLTGLHTCGNLASTCLQVFHAQTDCRLLCNIGCCYHLLKEEYSQREYFGNSSNHLDLACAPGFPMSEFLRSQRVSLGRNARMLAAQSVERCLAAKELPNISLFYRALLEVLLCANDAGLKDTVQVGKIRKFNSFAEYVQLCALKANLDMSTLSTGDLERVTMKYADDRSYLDLFYLLRMSFAPVIESIILLDRLLYLKECGYEQSYLISAFDAVISPRHYAIVALKV